MFESFLICLLFGVFSGLLAGLFGIGGGIVLVPFFVWLFESREIDENLLMVMAIATSLATIVMTSMAAIMAHHRLGGVLWDKVFDLLPGILLGTVTGAVLADFLPHVGLRTLFAGFLFYVAWNMGKAADSITEMRREDTVCYRFAGYYIGFLSAILGIGGGTITVPLMIKKGMPMRYAVAVSSACGLPIALMGTLSYAILGWRTGDISSGFLGYVYLPAFFGIIASSLLTAPIGARLAHKLPTRTLKRYFSILLCVVAFKLLQVI